MAEFDVDRFVGRLAPRSQADAEGALRHLFDVALPALEGYEAFHVIEHSPAATTARIDGHNVDSQICRIEYPDYWHNPEETIRINSHLYAQGLPVPKPIPCATGPTNQVMMVYRLGGIIPITFSEYIDGRSAAPSLDYDKDRNLGEKNYYRLGDLTHSLHCVTPEPNTREFDPLNWALTPLAQMGGVGKLSGFSREEKRKLQKALDIGIALRDQYFPPGHTRGKSPNELTIVHGDLNPLNVHRRKPKPTADGKLNQFDEEFVLIDWCTAGVTTKEFAAAWDAIRFLDGVTHFGRKGTFGQFVAGYKNLEPGKKFDPKNRNDLDIKLVEEFSQISTARVFCTLIYYGQLNPRLLETVRDRLMRHSTAQKGRAGRFIDWRPQTLQNQQPTGNNLRVTSTAPIATKGPMHAPTGGPRSGPLLPIHSALLRRDEVQR